jgi:heavy metal sensor kinase
LTLWYTLIFAVSTCVAFLLFYTLITSFIQERTDQDLLDQVIRFSTLIRSDGIEAVEKSTLIEAQAAGVRKVFFRLLSLNGQAFSSSNMSYWSSIDFNNAAMKDVLRGGNLVYDTIDIPGRKEKVRILYASISPSVILQVGQVTESYSRFLDAFRRVFIFSMAFLILFAGGVGWFMARRAVSGVEAVTRTARLISVGTLAERVPVKPRGDEIDQLAITFNQMLDRIQALLSEIREISDNIAHDLRSPITRIRGIAEVTLTATRKLEDYEEMAASTIEECDRLLEMINTMLTISKTESGLEQFSGESLDLTHLVRQACELFLPVAEDKGLSLQSKIPDAMKLKGDARMIQRMLANLLDNAIKYTRPGGRIDVTVCDGQDQIAVQVSDTGMGISEHDLQRIFGRFYRCDQSRSQAGTGLGLSLARAIARAHGGDISAVSTLGQGSTFTIKLPKTQSA